MTIKYVNPEELRDYVGSHHENAYVLVDVRQPDEYARSHIPGAKLIPLPELVQSMDQLPTDKELVFYCHSGGRSMSAAAMVEDEGFSGPLYNLSGGMLAWDGGRVADFPRVEMFAGQNAVEMFKTAMNLEKGAEIFYETVGRDYAQHPWAAVFDRLSKAEATHARIIYGHWQRATNRSELFESTYAHLSGDVLEGGLSLDEALEKVSLLQANPCVRLVELALQIEYAAFDLYRSLADQAREDESRQAFTQLSQAEKGHMQSLIRVIDEC